MRERGEGEGERKKSEYKGGEKFRERRWRRKMENAPVTLPSWKVPQGKNVTKPKESEYVWREWAEKRKREREKKERSWISTPLPENAPSSSWSVRPPWNEKAKQTCSPRLYLVNHQHYKPVLQALWGRKEGERERKSEKRLAQKILAGRDKQWKYLIKVEHVLCYLSEYLTSYIQQTRSLSSICPNTSSSARG